MTRSGRRVPVLTPRGLGLRSTHLLGQILGDRIEPIHEPIAGGWYWDHTDLTYPLFPPLGHGPNVRCRPVDKLLFSTLRVPDDDPGPRIEKLNLNSLGIPERLALARGIVPRGWPPRRFHERFLPEVEDEMHVSNVSYVCFGSFVSLKLYRLPAETIEDIKAAEGEFFDEAFGCRSELHPFDAPEFVKARAREWCLDYGSLDWVSGHVVDINKTPTAGPPDRFTSRIHQFALHGVDLLAWFRERIEAALPG